MALCGIWHAQGTHFSITETSNFINVEQNGTSLDAMYKSTIIHIGENPWSQEDYS